MNRQQILSRLAKRGVPVLYSTGQWNVWQRKDADWQQASPFGYIQLSDSVHVDHAPKWLLRFPSHPYIDQLSLSLGSRRLKRLIQQRQEGPYLLHIFNPEFQPYAEKLRPSRLVYHAYDLFEHTPGWNRAAAEQEAWLLKHADLRIASSEAIAQVLADKCGKEVRVLPNGADVAAFQQARMNGAVPADLRNIPRPIIGYVGRMNRKVDFALIAELAARRSEWQFILLGPIASLDHETKQGLDRCRSLGNVHELGERRYFELPAYTANLDVAIMPYRVGPGLWTGSGYPLKLHEYLASDKPIVSQFLPSLAPFREVLSFASGADEWEHEIDFALKRGGAGVGRRVSVAAENDWSVRADTIAQWFEELCRQ